MQLYICYLFDSLHRSQLSGVNRVSMDMPKDKTTVRNPVLSAGRGADLLNVQGQILA